MSYKLRKTTNIKIRKCFVFYLPRSFIMVHIYIYMVSLPARYSLLGYARLKDPAIVMYLMLQHLSRTHRAHQSDNVLEVLI